MSGYHCTACDTALIPDDAGAIVHVCPVALASMRRPAATGGGRPTVSEDIVDAYLARTDSMLVSARGLRELADAAGLDLVEGSLRRDPVFRKREAA